MKKDLIDITLAAEKRTNIQTHMTALLQEIDFTVGLDDSQRKRLQRIGLANETFSRGILDVARQNPPLVPAQIDLAKLQRDLDAREQLLPVLRDLQKMAKLVEDTTILLGVDVYEAARALYKTLQVMAEANGLSEVLAELAKRFAGQGKRPKTVPPGGDATTPSGGSSPSPQQ
jgi:hypothetical protein